MKAISTVLESSWAQALALSLLHSLWQGAAIFLLVIISLRFVSLRDSTTRYKIATSGLMLMFITVVATFLYQLSTYHAAVVLQRTISFSQPSGNVVNVVAVPETTWQQFTAFITASSSIIAAGWIVGTIVFSFRLIGGWWYIWRLRSKALLLNDEWQWYVLTLAEKLRAVQKISIAESFHVSAPVVIGCIRPMILVPVGFLSGLSTDQVESILLHELMHIRRHDYLINIIQSVIEALLFFNPFVWIVSNMMRIEREHCCDDAVVSFGNAKTYAIALAQLAEVRISKAGFAVSLAANKHQLLNRIKRIMEKSVRNYSGREKLIPVLLLVTGLACASWITINGKKEFMNHDQKITATDTTVKKKHAVAKKAKDAVEEQKPVEETVEIIESHDAPPPIFAVPPIDPQIDIPPIPALDFSFDNTFNFQLDTIHPMIFNNDWEKFGEEFEAKFKEKFGDFYEKNHEGFDKMMAELEANMKERFDDTWLAEANAAAKQAADQMALHAKDLEFAAKFQQENAARQAEAMVLQQQALHDMERQMKKWEKEHAEQFKSLQDNMKKMEENMKKFESALREQLISDGYLKKNEKISDMQWDDNGDIKINGVKIKDSDKKKYDELHKKYFGDGHGEFHYVD